MYRAKSAGKAQYALYAPWMDDVVLGRLELLGELRQARPGEDFICTISRSSISRPSASSGVEAPPRWRHPTRDRAAGRLHPHRGGERPHRRARPLGARAGVPPGRELAGHDAGGAGAQRERQRLRAAAPASRLRPRRPRRARRGGARPRRLVLEITENVVIGDHVAVVGEMLEALQLMGRKLALDDFGIGYSSLDARGAPSTRSSSTGLRQPARRLELVWRSCGRSPTSARRCTSTSSPRASRTIFR